MQQNSALTAEQCLQFGRLLQESRRTLRQRLDEALGNGVAEWQGAPPGEVTDTKDQATRNLSAAASAAELTRIRAALGAIDLALERLEAGAYGWCTRCGDPIALERLHSAPSAPRCRHCQEMHEATHTGRLHGLQRLAQ